MVSLKRSKAVMELGKQLVAQLQVGDDLLGSWMAHDVAQRIETADKAPDEAQAEAQDACAKAILKLWQHRNALPKHSRPFGELEPILRTLASLDVDHTAYRYYPAVLREAATAEADDHSKKWLELATGLDYSARILIEFALRTAASHAASKAEPWIDLALRAGIDEGPEIPVIKFVLAKDGAGEEDEGTQDAALADRLSRLEGFIALATSLVEDLRQHSGP